MSDLFFSDSKGRYHQVCIQLYESSCGPACVAMIERVYKHLNRSDESRARQISQKYPGNWTIPGGSYYISNLSSVLNAEGIKAYKAKDVTYPNVYSYLKYYASFSTPVIAQVVWYAGGAHFVMCAIRDPDDKFVFYDPFYGIVEQSGSYFPYYYASGGKATPSTSALGYFNGWLAITYR